MEREETKNDPSRRDPVKTTAAGVGATALAGPGAKEAEAAQLSPSWDMVADVVVVGSGAAGLPAAIAAIDEGASVIVVEANYDVGGHAIVSGGNTPLGGGTSAQKKYGIADSPDLVFSDLTDWSVVQPNGSPDFRYNDRAVIRAFADNCVARNATVNRAARANLHIILDNHPAAAQQLVVKIFGAVPEFEIISIPANHRIRLNDNIVADHAVIADAHVGVDDAVASDFDVITDENPGLNDGVFANLG